MAGDRTARRPDGLRGERPRELPRGGRFCGQGRVSCGSWPVALTEASANAPVIAAVFVQVQWKANRHTSPSTRSSTTGRRALRRAVLICLLITSRTLVLPPGAGSRVSTKVTGLCPVSWAAVTLSPGPRPLRFRGSSSGPRSLLGLGTRDPCRLGARAVRGTVLVRMSCAGVAALGGGPVGGRVVWRIRFRSASWRWSVLRCGCVRRWW